MCLKYFTDLSRVKDDSEEPLTKMNKQIVQQHQMGIQWKTREKSESEGCILHNIGWFKRYWLTAEDMYRIPKATKFTFVSWRVPGGSRHVEHKDKRAIRYLQQKTSRESLVHVGMTISIFSKFQTVAVNSQRCRGWSQQQTCLYASQLQLRCFSSSSASCIM